VAIQPPWNFSEGVPLGNTGYGWDGSVPGSGPPPPPPYSGTLPSPFAFYGDRVIYPSLIEGSVVILPTDFISKLQQGETISSATAAASVYSGSDPDASALITGSPSISGTVVYITVSGGVLGVTYEIRITATTSLGQQIPLTGYLSVVPDLL
jgi:hypothetical protein